MTVDEIHRVYDDAYKQYQREPVNGWSAEKAERFALCSVVRALRDEMGDPSTFKSAKPECCGRGVPNYKDGSEECCCQPDVWLLHEELLERINEILGAAGDEAAAACATSQTEGEVHDGRISQSLSPTRRGRSEVAGPLEGSGSGATPDNQRGEEVARAVFGNHEAGRKRDVGGEGNNGLNEKVAGGSTREDEKAVEAAGDKGPVTVNSPATDPCPDCGGRKYLAKHALNGTYYVHCHCPKLKATDAAPAVCVWAYDVRTDPWPWRSSCGNGWRDSKRTCPQCKKQVKFTEANHG